MQIQKKVGRLQIATDRSLYSLDGEEVNSFFEDISIFSFIALEDIFIVLTTCFLMIKFFNARQCCKMLCFRMLIEDTFMHIKNTMMSCFFNILSVQCRIYLRRS